jgi:hypothetical protein
MRLVGAFATSTRRPGGAPEPTGRTYPMEVTVTADDPLRPGHWSPASGVLTVETRGATSIAAELRAEA